MLPVTDITVCAVLHAPRNAWPSEVDPLKITNTQQRNFFGWWQIISLQLVGKEALLFGCIGSKDEMRNKLRDLKRNGTDNHKSL